jgi:hypothetical protein
LTQAISHVRDRTSVEHGGVAHDKLPTLRASCRPGHGNRLFP